MPPKTTFSREEVIQAAFEVVQEQGLSDLSARNVARKLGSSTAPVYSQFATMSNLEREVIIKIKDLLIQYSLASYTDKIFLNMGVGIAIFAREHKLLYRAMFLEKSDYKDILCDYHNYLSDIMAKDSRFSTMSESERGALLTKMALFTYGLATMICVGIIEEDSNESIIKNLLNVGSVIIENAIKTSNNNIQNDK